MLKTRDTESKVSYNLHVHSGVTSAMAKRPELSTMKTIIAKTYGEPVQVSQEFFGLFKTEKAQILSNIDYEASAKSPSIKESDYSPEELKKWFEPDSIWDEEFFEVLARNNEGFIAFDEYEKDSLKRGLKWLKSVNNLPLVSKMLKGVKTMSSYKPLKVVEGKEEILKFDPVNEEKSLIYYEKDCLGKIKENIKEVESSNGDKKFLSDLKEFLRAGEEGIKNARRWFDFLKKSLKTEEFKGHSSNESRSNVSQEFFGLFKKKIKVLSKIDYEATASNLGRNYDYSGDDLKDIIDFNNVFEDEAFEIIGRNNEGFSPEYGGDEDLQDALSSLKECMPIEANIIAKKIKLSNDYSPIKTLDKEHIDREYSLELFEKSIKYYEEDCIGSCRESLKEAESDGANPKFIANLKDYIRLSQRAIEEAKDTINILKKNFKFEEAKD